MQNKTYKVTAHLRSSEGGLVSMPWCHKASPTNVLLSVAQLLAHEEQSDDHPDWYTKLDHITIELDPADPNDQAPWKE